MSVIISYQPIKDAFILDGATSSTYSALEECFGKFPIKLNGRNLDMLRGLAVAHKHSRESVNPYEELWEGVRKYGEILVSATW